MNEMDHNKHGRIYEITYLKESDEVDIRPWGMTIFLSREDLIRDLEDVTAFIKNLDSKQKEMIISKRENKMNWNDDKTSQVWGKILQHKFFAVSNKDLHIEDLLTEIANRIYEMELQINCLKQRGEAGE